MTEKNTTPVLENVLLVVFIALLVALVLAQANPLTHYPSRDGGVYAYVGHIILEGKLPYIDVWESKTPGIFYLDAFALWLGKGTRWGIWFVEYVFLFVSTWLGYKLMRAQWKQGGAIFGTIIWLFGLNRVLSGGNFTEEYPLLFNFLALYVFWKSLQKSGNLLYNFVIGLTLGLSFLFRANNIGVQISIILAFSVIGVVRKKTNCFWKKIVALGAGTMLVLGCTTIYFWSNHALYAMIEAAFLYNFSYTGNHADILSSILPGFEKLGFAAWAGLAGYVLLIAMFIKDLKEKAIDYVPALMVIGLPVEIALSSISGRGYGHYFISWLPMVALLSAYAFSWLSPKVFTILFNDFVDKRTSITLSLVTGILVLGFWNTWVEYSESFKQILLNRRNGVETISPVAQYIRSNTDPEDTVLIWGGQAGLNLMARRDAPTAYIFYPLFVNSPILPKLEAGFLNDITARPPELIVDAYIDAPYDVLSLDAEVRSAQIASGEMAQYYGVTNLGQVFDFFIHHYQLETEIDNYNLYRLNNP